MMLRDEVCEAAELIAHAGEEWRRAYDAWQVAVSERERLCALMDRRMIRATGNLSLARYEAACRKRYFHDVGDARRKAAAIRSKPAVEAAVAERDRTLATEDAKVVVARSNLAAASKTMARYGTVGLDMIGLSASELHRLARRPSVT